MPKLDTLEDLAMTPRKDETHEQFNERRRNTRVTSGGQDTSDSFKLDRYSRDGSGKTTAERFVRRGRTDAEVLQLPDPSFVARTSTLYDRDGEVTQQWVIEKPEQQAQQAAFEAMFRAAAEALPRVPMIEQPASMNLNYDLCTAYPIGDHHIGMLAWKHENQDDSYDLDIAEKLLIGAFEHLVSIAPPSSEAVIPILGDYFHYDSQSPLTPAHGNILDADGRFQKMISTGVRVARRLIERGLEKHELVTVICESGNHDPYSTFWLMVVLANVYEANPRVRIDMSPAHFHYYEFGRCLLGTHHGHGRAAKAAQLPGIMAHDVPEAWGRTRYRVMWTGHVHSQNVFTFPGCRVESMPILAPADAYAAHEGYRADREMKAIVLHREYGEVGRHVVNPAMLRAT